MLFKAVRSKISSVLVFAMLLTTIMPMMAFGATVQLKDIADSYAQKEIQALVEAGIISGYEDNTFQPKKEMTRAELAKIIVLSLGLKENSEKAAAFQDVEAKSWYRGFVGALVESGITQGTSATTFSPDAKVTREELVVFFVRAFGLEETATKLVVDAKLSDLYDVSEWAKADVSLAFKMGFVNGIENADGSLKFSPKTSAERQALARLAYEFKTNKSKYLEKAKELSAAIPDVTTPETTVPETTTPDVTTPGTAGGDSSSKKRDNDKRQYFTVVAARALDNQTVQVTLDKDIVRVSNVLAFNIDGLTITMTEAKVGTANVVLTTSAHNLGQVYTLSYGGVDTGKTFEGGATTLTEVGSQTYEESYQLVAEGIYGPADGQEPATFKQNLLIAGPEITLQNVVIKGNLILGTQVGEGDVTLNNVTVEGDTIVRGGGANSIHLNNTIMVSIIVDKRSGAVRLVADNGTSVQQVTLQSSVILQNESNIAAFQNVSIAQGMPASSTVRLAGIFETVDIVATNIMVTVPYGFIQRLSVHSSASNTAIDLDGDATVAEMIIDAFTAVTGPGRVDHAVLNVNSSFERLPITHEGTEPTQTESNGLPQLYFVNITNGSIQMEFNRPVTDAVYEDFLITATLDGQPVELEGLDYITAEQRFIFKSFDASMHYGKTLKITVAPAEGSSKFSRFKSAEVDITGFEGTIVDVNNDPVAGAKIEFRRGSGATEGPIVATVVTDNQGRYKVTVPPGIYTGTIIKEGFLPTYVYGVAANNVYNTEHSTAFRIPAVGETRIVLVWGENPHDLDSHLVGPQPNAGGQFHTWYSDREYYYNSVLFDDLDWDDTSSYGPETTTIRYNVNGTYRFYVHHYSGSSTLRKSGAEVRVYQNNSPEPVQTYKVPTGEGMERYWAAFEMNITDSGISFTGINQLVNSETEAQGNQVNIAMVSSSYYTVNNDTNVISNVSANTPVATFKSKLIAPSGGTFEVYEADSTTLRTGNVADGDKVIVTAANGITKKHYTVAVNAVDNQAPNTVTGLTYEKLYSNNLRLIWNTQQSDTVGYAVYQGDQLLGTVNNNPTVTNTVYDVSNLAAGTHYTFSVKAYDAAGNYSVPATKDVTTAVRLAIYDLYSAGDIDVTSSVYGPFVKENTTHSYIIPSDVQSTDFLVVKFSDVLSQDLAGELIVDGGLKVQDLSVQSSVYEDVYLVFKPDSGLSLGVGSFAISGLKYSVSSQVYEVEPFEIMVVKE